MARGLYGPLIIEPAEPDPRYDRDYVVTDRDAADRVVADRAPVDRYDYVADSGEGDVGVSLPVYLV